jgi:hypothetical protein
MQQLDYNNRKDVSTWSLPRCYKQGTKSVVRELCAGDCEDRIRARAAEESLLLEAVAREMVVKTQNAGKGLAGAVGICKLWRLAMAL